MYVEFIPHEIDSRSSSYGKSSNSNNNENDENDEIIQLTPAFTYLGQYVIPRIIEQFLAQKYGAEKFKFVQESHKIDRRSAYYWDWTSNVNCATVQQANTSVFSTSCSNSGRITQYCFSGDMATYVEINGSYKSVTLRDMEEHYGKSMITYHNGEITESKFMTFVHVDHHITTTFLEISLSSTIPEITQNHLLFRINDDIVKRVFSSDLRVGDELFVFDPETKTLNTEEILSIKNVVRVGIYSPMPAQGHNFFVNNVLVSPFSTVNVPALNAIHYVYAQIVSYLN